MRALAGRALAGLAGAMLWAGAAFAQSQDVPQVISPLRVETDHNNVNIVSGKTTIEPPALAVPGAPNLRYDRVQNAAPYARGIVTGQTESVPIVNWSVHSGSGSSESFVCADWQDCASVTGTGSRIPGNNEQCRVLDGYQIRQEGAGQGGRGVPNAARYQSPGQRTIDDMRRDPEARRAMEEAWRLSHGDGPTGQKNEYGFWAERVGNHFRIGRMLEGYGRNIVLQTILDAHQEMPNARIFFYVHPFRIHEAGVTSLGFSQGDIGIASRFHAIIIAVARPEPYTGRGWLFMSEDSYYLGR